MAYCLKRALEAAGVDISGINAERLKEPHNVADAPGICTDLGLDYIPPGAGDVTISGTDSAVVILGDGESIHAEFCDLSDIPDSGVLPDGRKVSGMILTHGGKWKRRE